MIRHCYQFSNFCSKLCLLMCKSIFGIRFFWKQSLYLCYVSTQITKSQAVSAGKNQSNRIWGKFGSLETLLLKRDKPLSSPEDEDATSLRGEQVAWWLGTPRLNLMSLLLPFLSAKSY